MPVYLFTFHAYCSWMPDRRAGYVRRGIGILRPDPTMAAVYRNRAAHPPVRFDEIAGWTIIDGTDDLCRTCDWRLYEVAVTTTHVHVLVGWRGDERRDAVAERIKQHQGRAIGRLRKATGPWFSRGKSQARPRSKTLRLPDAFPSTATRTCAILVATLAT